MDLESEVLKRATQVFSDHKKSFMFTALVIVVLIIIVTAIRLIVEMDPVLVSRTASAVQKFGLLGGFLISAVGSIWFLPVPYEIVVAPILKFYNPQVFAILVIAAGAATADIFNFLSGRKIGEALVRKHVEPSTIARIERFFAKYGIATLVIFGAIAPVTSYDVIAFVFGGFSKMKFKHFLPLTYFCRILHFTAVLLISDTLIKIAGIPL